MTERIAWTDPALNREFERVYKQINGTPERMRGVEEALKALSHIVQDVKSDHEQDMREVKVELEALRTEIRGAEWSRSQIIGALGVLVAFFGVIGSVLVAVFG